MTLSDAKIGGTVVVTGIGSLGALKRRLIDMGITPGVLVSVRKVAPLGDPIEIRLRGYELTIRRSDAMKITVSEVKT